MEVGDKIFVAGHRGLAGSAIVRKLAAKGYNNLLLRTHAELDLTDRTAVRKFFEQEQPDQVILAAARVGGIHANNEYPVDFLLDNLYIQNHVVEAAQTFGCRKLLFLGSSCIYPKLAPQPMPEQCLMTGPLEPTNQWYATAKIAGIRLCQAYRQQFGFNAICAMPTNLYGPGDNYDLNNSHVLPAILRKCHEAKVKGHTEVTLWGTGMPRREFLHADDLADACIFLMNNYSNAEPVNIGVGNDVSIRELAEIIAAEVGYTGRFVFDTSRPDGTPRKLMDVTRLTELGWHATIDLSSGLKSTYRHFLNESLLAE